MGLKEIKQELAVQEKDTLIKHLIELYKKYDVVKKYFDFYLNPKEDDLLLKYKEKVRAGFFPKRGMSLKLSLSRKAINEFKKFDAAPEKSGDLLLYYVECGAEFINKFGFINESFYSSARNTFEMSLKLLKKADVLFKYQDRVNNLVEETRDSGYGFGDEIKYLYSNYYE